MNHAKNRKSDIMNFLTPLAFLLALTIPIIIAMYLLKLRRVEQTVASTYLWRRMVRDVEANAPWQKLRRNLLLLLQLLIALLLMIALTRPFTWASGPAGNTVVLILDHSASMAATDVEPTRLTNAKAQINQWIDSLPSDTSVTLIAAGQTPQVVVASTQDRRLLKRGLNDIAITSSPSNLNAALTLAAAIANQNSDVAIQLYSDFAGQTDAPDGYTNLNISTELIGSSDQNQAISKLTLEHKNNQTSGFVQVANLSNAPAQRRVLISSQPITVTQTTRQLINVIDLQLAPQSTESIVLNNLAPEINVLHAQFANPDLLPRDDQAWAIAQNQTPTNILLVSSGNRFLQTALALLPNVSVTTQRPTDFEQRDFETSQTEAATLTIFDTYIPITATLPSGNLFFIGPTNSTPFFDVGGTIEQPLLEKNVETDPRLRNLSLSDINVLAANRMVPAADWSTTLIRDASSQAPLLFAGEAAGLSSPPLDRASQRIAVLAFDIRNSDLPLQVDFPLLLANLIDWLGGGSISIPSQLTPGETLSFAPPPAIERVDLLAPNGTTQQLIPEAGRVTIEAIDQPGLYTLSWPEPSNTSGPVAPSSGAQDKPVAPSSGAQDQKARANFVVNAYTAAEANIAPNPAAAAMLASTASPNAANGPASASQSSQGISQQTPQRSPREWWRMVALIALIVLMIEWLVYHRGTLARLLNTAQ